MGFQLGQNMNPVAQGQTVQQKIIQEKTNPVGNIVDQALNTYPILKSLNSVGVIDTNNPDKYGYLEDWPIGETGSNIHPRPAQIPLNRVGVQVLKPETTANDVAGDLVSHNLINTDPYVKQQYTEFKNSFTGNQIRFLYGDYEQDKKVAQEPNLKFNDWLDRSGAPGALRGYIFNQYNDSAKKEFGYTDNQKANLDNIKKYITKGRR